MTSFFDLIQNQSQNDPEFKDMMRLTAGKLTEDNQNSEEDEVPRHPQLGEFRVQIQVFSEGVMVSTPHADFDQEELLEHLRRMVENIQDSGE